jgi:hypothetical protein
LNWLTPLESRATISPFRIEHLARKRQCVPQRLKALVNVPMAQDQPASTILKISQRPEAIVFQFEEPLWVVEGFERSSELGWRDRRQHAYILSWAIDG